MNTVIVWVLIMWLDSSFIQVDNISSQENCRILAANISRDLYVAGRRYSCRPVRKVMVAK